MKKFIIATVVGGIVLFMWQFLSFAAVNLHSKATTYTPKQDTILQFLSSNLQEGQYLLPTVPPNSSMDDEQKLMEAANGKPWASIAYHKSLDTGMTLNLVRGYIADIAIIALVVWLLLQFKQRKFLTILLANIAIGSIAFMNIPYQDYIWYKTFDINAYLLDAVVGWGLVGLWLGWYLKEK